MARALGVAALLGALSVGLPAAAGAMPGPLGATRAAVPLANTATFEDSTGDDPAGPDITTVTVSNNDAGLITFQVKVPNRPSLTQDMIVDILADTDNNTQTGDTQALGADYDIELFQNQVNLFKWDGSNFSTSGGVPQSSLIYSYSGGVLTIKISAAEFGGTKKFNFDVDVTSGVVFDPNTGNTDFTNAHSDFAPDLGHGFYAYEVKIGALKLVAKRFTLRPQRPVAGRSFSAILVGARSDTGATLKGGQVGCTASLGGRRLQARVHGFVNGGATCAWSIPSSAHGQTVHGSVTVHFESLSLSKSFTAKVA